MTGYDELKRRLLQAIERGQMLAETEFSELALDLFAFQREHNDFYRSFCQAGRDHPAVDDWRAIPAVPQAAFKRARVSCFPPSDTPLMFQTSGTTEGTPGRHYFHSLDLYEAAIVPNFKAHLLPDHNRIRTLMLTASPEEAPHSSLAHMMQVVWREFGCDDNAAKCFFLCSGELDAERLLQVLAEESAVPHMLLGTAFAFSFLLNEMERHTLRVQLAPGSVIMETGGFKGRTREIPRTDFYRALSDAFGIPAFRIINEYGMTELSSQFYDASLIDECSTDEKTAPPWSRILIVDPLTGEEMPEGELGLIRIIDLANLDSVLAIQTEDVGVRIKDRFRVLGRVARADIRGCSLDAERVLGDRFAEYSAKGKDKG